MKLILLLALLLSVSPSDAEELINQYRNLPEGAVQERLALIDQIGRMDADVAQQFIGAEMESAREDPVRARAFFYWARRHNAAVVADYLESKKGDPRFGALIPLIPTLPGFDTLPFLIRLYEEEGTTRHRRLLGQAIAKVDNDEAFVFLEEQWSLCDDFREAFELLPSLLSMEGARSPVFLDGLLLSPFPFARYEGAARMIRPGEAQNLRRVEKLMESESNLQVRTEVLRALALNKSSDAAWVLLKSAASHPPDHLYEVVELLASMPPSALIRHLHWEQFLKWEPLLFQVAVLACSISPELTQSLERSDLLIIGKGTKHALPGVRMVTAVALRRMEPGSGRYESTVSAIMSSSKVDTKWDILTAVQRFRLDDEGVIKKVLQLLKNARGESRIKAAQVVGALRVQEALPLLERCFQSSEVLTRIAAIRALGDLGGALGIELLITRLPKEEGRAAWEIARSLKRITGRSFGIEVPQWEKWWESHREGWFPPPKKTSLWFPDGARKDRYGFYGLAIDSHHIVFVLDVSGSMEGDRIRRLSEELTRTIKALTGEHYINLIFFSSYVKKWKKTLVPMGSKGKGFRQAALARARYLSAEGSTDLYGGLKTALEDEEVDAVILLSDGDPTVGELVLKDAILEAVEKMNRSRQMTIHVVAIGGADRRFLRKLALDSGGTFTSR